MPFRPACFGVYVLAAAVLSPLAGCVPTSSELATKNIAVNPSECRGVSAATCFFRNSPARLELRAITIPGRSYQFFPLAQELEFIDGQGKQWIAPRQTLTDGASIPEVFVPIVGDPRSPEFTNAAALHDAYCGIGNEDGPVYRSRTWQETHRLFYDGLIVGGTPELKAKVMFAAVWLGGPRWYPQSKRSDTRVQNLPKALMQQSMRETKQYIQRRNPTMPQLVAYLTWHEQRMARVAHGGNSRAPAVNDDEISPISPGGGEEGAVQP